MDDKNINDVWLLLGQMDSKLDRVVEDTEDHEKRLTAVEHKHWFYAGIAACVSASAGVISTFLFRAH